MTRALSKSANSVVRKPNWNRLPNRQTADDNKGPDTNDPSIKQALYGVVDGEVVVCELSSERQPNISNDVRWTDG